MNWDVDGTGNIITSPLLGYETAVLATVVCGLRLTIARNEQELESGGISVQLGMTPAQALELGGVLQRMAQQAMKRPGGKPS
jgi:hypothetical protein